MDYLSSIAKILLHPMSYVFDEQPIHKGCKEDFFTINPLVFEDRRCSEFSIQNGIMTVKAGESLEELETIATGSATQQGLRSQDLVIVHFPGEQKIFYSDKKMPSRLGAEEQILGTEYTFKMKLSNGKEFGMIRGFSNEGSRIYPNNYWVALDNTLLRPFSRRLESKTTKEPHANKTDIANKWIRLLKN